MIEVLVVADSGSVMSSITATLRELDDVDIVAYASGTVNIDRIVRANRPDVVLIDEMRWPRLALARIAEARAAAPEAAIVALAPPDADWAITALSVGVATIVPRDLESATFGLVLREVVAPTVHAATAQAA